jgi:hypothetical protein
VSGLLSFIESLIAWQNVLFTTTVGVGTLLFGVQAMGLLGDHEHEVDHDVGGVEHDHEIEAGADHDLDADHGADHDLDADHDLEHDHDVDGDHDVDHDHDAEGHGGSFIGHALRAFGLGRVPLSLLLPIALVSFGFVGLCASMAFGGIGAQSEGFSEVLILPVLGIAALGSAVTLHLAGRAFRRIAPDSKSASDKLDLLGLVGVVKSGKVDLEYGQVRVVDSFNNQLDLPCVALDEQRQPKYGDEVVLVDWDPAVNRFKIVPFVLDGDDEQKRLDQGRRRARELRLVDRRKRATNA